VEARLQRIRRDWWETARASWTNSLANPLCTSFETLPAYANAALALRERAWGPNALTDGNFEQLDRLLAAGWKQLREESPQLMSHVELSRELPHGGAAALKMSVVSRGDAQLATALQPAVKIVASPLAVRAGQWIRLHGWARVPRTANGASGELMVYDNLTGAELAELLRGSNEWREFNILRVMPADGMLQIHFALRGSGEVFLDDVTLQVSDPHLALSSVPQ
jgi:hypothetical protein